ncbi:hypothetical protein I5677_14420 [Mobilitalea sibirica]|uniref:Uncharacterized protein n=1 Tax=Mobilitalea sibirica TaxID=1462919 RepID=A0A8J7L0D3_9FIRM|nr:hypothetical protein [Mobilitalea sibirica]MBH1942093.1 hypothetical protein [Mobilitalea sibirica]
MNLMSILVDLGIYTIWLTPLTFVMGIIYAIKKPEKEATPYKFMAVISAYLIIFTLLYRS